MNIRNILQLDYFSPHLSAINFMTDITKYLKEPVNNIVIKNNDTTEDVFVSLILDEFKLTALDIFYAPHDSKIELVIETINYRLYYATKKTNKYSGFLITIQPIEDDFNYDGSVSTYDKTWTFYIAKTSNYAPTAYEIYITGKLTPYPQAKNKYKASKYQELTKEMFTGYVFNDITPFKVAKLIRSVELCSMWRK